MSSLRERLSRLREDTGSSAKPVLEAPKPAGDSLLLDTSRDTLDVSSLELQLHGRDGNQFLLRRRVYPFPYRHGYHELSDLFEYAPYLRSIAVRQNQGSEEIDIYKLLFLDTETTGLGVGTGNVPFMIGFGYYTEQAFIVEQALIRHPGEEKAMLSYLLEHMKDKAHLVTYNGRTFDWPVLVNRFILNGWRRRGPEPGHLDFLHPSRALWRNTLASCRLSMIEEARLGIQREQDVPGSMAPTLYFQYLADSNPAHLEGIYLHNEKDVLSLASLAVHFGLLLGGASSGRKEMSPEGEELFRTACWLEQHGNSEEAGKLFDRLDSFIESGDSSGWSLALASRYKRAGQYDRALPLWIRSAERAEGSVLPKLDAHIELAMYYEHHSKQLLMALNYTEKAIELVNRRVRLSRDAAKRRAEKDALLHRAARLRKKLNG